MIENFILYKSLIRLLDRFSIFIGVVRIVIEILVQIYFVRNSINLGEDPIFFPIGMIEEFK